MVPTHYATIFLLLVYLFFGVDGIRAVAIYALIAVAYSSFMIWFMRLRVWFTSSKSYEPKAGFMGHYAFAVGTAIGMLLYVVLLVMCSIPNGRQIKRRFQKWSGYDREFEVIES